MPQHEVWIPIIMFVAMALVISLFLWFRYRSREDLQTTIRSAIEKGHELSPELIKQLGSKPRTKNRDLRWGLLSLGLAAGASFFGIMLGRFEDEAMYVFQGLAGFPAAIGIAFLIMHFFGGSKED